MILRPARASRAARMLSTLVGQNGREYKLQKVLQRHPKKPELSVCLALCNSSPFVLKPVSRSIFEHLQELRNEFGSDSRLRIHIDQVETESVVIYEYFKTDLLSLVENYPALPLIARKTILKEVGLALAEMHAKNWIHLDVKPNNVFLNWYVDSSDEFRLEKVVLGDLDCALKLQGEKLLNHRIGNVMWRSPEGQLGRGVGKPSEVFSFALLCLYVITGVQSFYLNFDEVEAEPEMVVLFKLLSTFGPLPDALVKHVNEEKAGQVLTELWQVIIENQVNGDFADWSEDVFPNLDDEAKRLLLRMTNLDPARRAPISDIITDTYWNVKEKSICADSGAGGNLLPESRQVRSRHP
ncbi:calcium/calmodulin dependent protein kinase-like protein [Melanomma pulvis-pyrius CBS 109.77]|uniref:Calcium/calmodulin dependent protein kinase-like protein n=1 Tax=Melanomma pulvis-pyrius CBS 109.77 TaxID=1314802 RepID=A0A6A6X338_9PLEO|nr:calcium/calmodulin dependent protein kinase-like protein [Melanomma pulvis-pyrius CBS 109.77]